MPRSPRRLAWFALCAALSGCTQLVEFDRDKIVAADGGGPGGLDAKRVDSAVTIPDGARPDADGPTSEAGPQCTQDTQCASDERCCMNECKKTSLALCIDCTTGCNASSADRCNNRTCGCGNGPACSERSFCMAAAAGAPSRCSECRDANDCAGRTDGKLQCFEGSCVRCDPATNAGCSGNSPICNASTRTCERCSSSPDNCAGSLVCTASGACGGCANAASDCTTPTAPICDATSTQCRACAGAVTDNPECMAQLSKRYCENQRCSTCRPGTDDGCDLMSNRPDCRLNADGQNECQACSTAAHCENAGVRRFCAADSGRCVECRASAECADPTKPFCDTADGTCKPCSAVAGGAGADNLWCLAETLTARSLCDPDSGRCVACVSASDCGANRPVCDAAMRICRACSMSTEAADCPNAASPACAANGRCVPCRNGGSRTACTGQPNDQCDGNTCVDCINDMGCTGQNHCNTSTRTCVRCTSDAHCNDMIACTTDRCQSNMCTSEPDDSRCSNADGFSCTVPTCTATGCVERPNHAPCTSATDCVTDMCVGTGGESGTGCSTTPICDLCVAGVCPI